MAFKRTKQTLRQGILLFPLAGLPFLWIHTAQRLRQGQPAASEEDADGGGAAPSPGAALTERL